ACRPEQVAFEVVFGVRDDAGAVVLLEHFAKEVRVRVFARVSLPVDRALGEDLLPRRVPDVEPSRALERVVGRAKRMAPTVPGADGVACHVGERPALAGVDALLVALLPDHVERVLHGTVSPRVRDYTRIALDVEGHGSPIPLLDYSAVD